MQFGQVAILLAEVMYGLENDEDVSLDHLEQCKKMLGEEFCESFFLA